MAIELGVELNAVRALLKSMVGKPGETEAREAQADRMLGRIRKAKISVEESPTLFAIVSECGFSKEVSGRLMTAIAQRAGAGEPSNRQKLQDYTALASYFKQEQWDSMKTGSAGDPLHTIISHGAQLGLRYPSESTWQLMTAIYLLVQNTDAAANALAPSEKNMVLKHVKSKGRRMLQAGVVEIPTLPDNPEVFRAAHADIYDMVFGSAHPVAHPFGVALRMYAPTIDMRCAPCNQLLGKQMGMVPMGQCSNQMGQNMAAQFAQMMMSQFMSQMTGGMMPMPMRMFGGAQQKHCKGLQGGPLSLHLEDGQVLQDDLRQGSSSHAIAGGGMKVLEDADEEAPVSHAVAAAHGAGKKQPRLSVTDASAQIREIMNKTKGEPGTEGEPTPKKTKGEPATKKVKGEPAILKRPAAAKPKSGSRAGINMERSRSQVLCRRLDGTSFSIPWGSRNGEWLRSEKQAVTEAKAWWEKEKEKC